MLIGKCIELGLNQVSGEPCLFYTNGIILFFYVNDIVMVYRLEKKVEVEEYVQRFMKMIEIRDMRSLIYFLGVRVIHDIKAKTVHLIQNIYMDKLVKEYNINETSQTSSQTLIFNEELASFDDEVDSARMHLYRKKVESICYSAIMTRSDIAKSASKLAEYLINSGPIHMRAADHCLRYLYGTKYLGIQYSAKGEDEITAMANHEQISTNKQANKQVFEATADASYANNSDRKSSEGYTFKLFGGMIDWASRKQLTVTTSTTEAELLSMLHAGKELI